MKKVEINPNRLLGADVLKGLAIILMVYGHISRVGTMRDVQNILVDYIYTFHMPIFLLISGFFFVPINNPVKSMQTTINKIFKPYFIFISLYILVIFWVNTLGYTTSNKIDNLYLSTYLEKVFLDPIGAYWFLHTLLVYQIVLSISIVLNKGQINWILFLMFFIIIFFVIKVIGLQISIDNMVFLIIGFLIRISNISLPSSFFGIILVSILYLNYSVLEISENFVIRILLILSIVSFIMYFSNALKNTIFSNFMSFIGRNTLIILVMHAFYINVMKLFMNQLLLIDKSGVLFSVSTTVIVISCSILSAYIFDYLKVSNYIFHVRSIYQPYTFKGKK